MTTTDNSIIIILYKIIQAYLYNFSNENLIFIFIFI